MEKGANYKKISYAFTLVPRGFYLDLFGRSSLHYFRKVAKHSDAFRAYTIS